MKLKRLLAMGLACTMAVALMCGCGGEKPVEDGKVRISIGRWPEKGAAGYEAKMEQVEQFEALYPDIEIVGDTYAYEINTFIAKATAGTLPTLFPTFFTEVDKIIDGGYALDLTEALNNAGWSEQMNADVLKYVSDENGNIFGIPFKVYAMGLYINKPLFVEAGLVDANGDVIIPQTYEEIYEAAKTIKEKTGKAGFGLPTINNHGGWHTVNVDWSYGTEFLSRAEDGTYTSTFDTPETIAAYEWVKKMRDANVFPDNPNLLTNDMFPLFGSGQLAMFFGEPAYISGIVSQYGMKPEDLMMASMPAGPVARCSQMGGDLYMISTNATPEQVDACLKWIDFTGYGPTLTEETLENIKKDCEVTLENNGVVLPKDAFYLWTDEESVQKRIEARAEYVNIPEENLEAYFAFDGVTLMPEPEAGCQELYAELDKVVQEIYANKDVDIAAMVSGASHDWQVNCLDNLK